MAKKILIVNKFYYQRGGDCIYSLNLERMLAAHGYEVAFFSMHYPENEESRYSSYFAPQVDFSGGVRNKISAVKRILGMGDVVSRFKRILADFHPDVVHLNNIHSYISPVVGALAKKAGCRVVWTLHDYKLLCPAYACLRGGESCELCYSDKSQVLKHRCMKGSLAASALAYIEAKKWNRGTLERFTDAFVCPSAFMRDKMLLGGFNADKLKVVCNFIDPVKIDRLSSLDCTQKADYYAYVGRLSQEKGVETLLKAASELPYKLKVAGGGPLAEEMKDKYAGANVQFLGHIDAEAVSELLAHARCVVTPSECYENNPLSVIESLCAGTPVVGARIGGIPELVKPENGLTYTPKSVKELSACICKVMESADYDYASIARASRKAFSAEVHMSLLEKVYNL